MASVPSQGSASSAAPGAGKVAAAPKAAAGASANPFARQVAKRSLTRASGARRRTR